MLKNPYPQIPYQSIQSIETTFHRDTHKPTQCVTTTESEYCEAIERVQQQTTKLSTYYKNQTINQTKLAPPLGGTGGGKYNLTTPKDNLNYPHKQISLWEN